MAKVALTWRDSVPPAEEKRETKVIRLLRDGGAADWGATEVRSSYVYPMSLRPLRKIAGVVAKGGGDIDVASAVELKEPAGLDVSQLLDKVFPTQSSVRLGDDNDATTTATTTTASTTINANNNNNKGGSSATTSNNKPPSERLRNSSKSNRGGDKSGKGTGDKAEKPVFYPYGNANTAPSSGGVVYGGYMLSHSIIPQVRYILHDPQREICMAHTRKSSTSYSEMFVDVVVVVVDKNEMILARWLSAKNGLLGPLERR